MARGRKGTGVEPRATHIRVTFTYFGRRKEPLDLKPTPPNIKFATRLVTEINDKIRAGTFNYADYFPNSQHAQKVEQETKPKTVEQAAKDLLSTSELAYSTKRGYELLLEQHVYPSIGAMPIKDVTYLHLAKILSGITEDDEETGEKGLSKKTRNNLLDPIRRTFALAFQQGWIKENVALRCNYLKIIVPEPDPFSCDEMRRILNYIGERFGEEVQNYFGVAFFTGMRTSEIIEIKWTDIDWNLKIMRVQRAYVRFRVKPPKTNQARNHELNEHALYYLTRQRKYTQFKTEHVFLDPVTGKRYEREENQRRRYWKPTLAALKMLYKEPYQTRHTYATLAIMAGAKPVWVAKQMGNSPEVIFKHYAKWIEKQDAGREAEKLNSYLGANSGANSGNIGGLDGNENS